MVFLVGLNEPWSARHIGPMAREAVDSFSLESLAVRHEGRSTMLREMMTDVKRVLQFFGIVFVVWSLVAGEWRHQDPAGVWAGWLIVVGMVLTVVYHARRGYALAILRDRIASRRCPACGYDLRASEGRCPECGRPDSRAAVVA